jgi:hypothetical protein
MWAQEMGVAVRTCAEQSAIRAGRKTGKTAEAAGQVTLIAEPGLQGDVHEVKVGSSQQMLSHGHAAPHYVRMGSDAKGPAEHAEEVRR